MHLRTKQRGAATVLEQLYQAGSMKCVLPRGGPDMEAVLVNTAGGITGGDRFEVSANVATGCTVTLTTQAAERAYKAMPDQTGHLSTTLTVENGARLNWLPQETILFNGSALRRRLTITLDTTAELLMVEPLVFGRAAMGETLTQARFDDRISITRGGTPLYLDAVRLEGDVAAHLANPFTANGAGAMAALVFASPRAEGNLDRIRALLPATGGVSLIGDTLVMRLLATDSHELRQTLVPVLKTLNSDDLPRCWMI